MKSLVTNLCLIIISCILCNHFDIDRSLISISSDEEETPSGSEEVLQPMITSSIALKIAQDYIKEKVSKTGYEPNCEAIETKTFVLQNDYLVYDVYMYLDGQAFLFTGVRIEAYTGNIVRMAPDDLPEMYQFYREAIQYDDAKDIAYYAVLNDWSNYYPNRTIPHGRDELQSICGIVLSESNEYRWRFDIGWIYSQEGLFSVYIDKNGEIMKIIKQQYM